MTVLAPTAADADALSTAFFLLGAEAAEAYTASHPEVGIVIVEEGAADGSPRLLTFGLRAGGFPAGLKRVKLDDVLGEESASEGLD